MTVGRFSKSWRRVVAICVFWIAQDRVRHEHVVATNASEGQEVFKISARRGAVKRNLRFLRPQTSRSFANEEQLRVEVARRIVEHASTVAHPLTFRVRAHKPSGNDRKSASSRRSAADPGPG